jgi:3-hydroxyisobutyrate dehydrogenase-like beta-hydroxyacid dehydrogenase
MYTMVAKREPVGFIGLGVMGMPMARHLANAGFPLTVYDVRKDVLARASGYRGMVAAESPKAVAAASDMVITMLPSSREVFDVVFGADGLSDGFSPGKLLLDVSSAEPGRTKEIAARLAGAGITMVDAPVSGAEAGAIAAELVFMVGGSAEAVTRVTPLLEVLGKKIFHLGEVGAGHAMKCINNLITAITFMATAEGLIMGKGYGLDPAVMNDVINQSTGMSWISRTHIAQRILSRRFDDPFKFDLMVKDIDIALGLAHTLNLKMPLSGTAQMLWHEIQAQVPKGSSVSALVQALEDSSGVPLVSSSGGGKA